MDRFGIHVPSSVKKKTKAMAITAFPRWRSPPRGCGMAESSRDSSETPGMGSFGPSSGGGCGCSVLIGGCDDVEGRKGGREEREERESDRSPAGVRDARAGGCKNNKSFVH